MRETILKAYDSLRRKCRLALRTSYLLPLASYLLIAPAVADEGGFDFDRWNTILHTIQDRAVAENIDPRVINEVIQNGAFVPEVIKRDKNQAEFKLTLDEYLARAVNADRIAKGRAARKKYPTLLRRTEQKYGVPPHIIMAFWGMESNYGDYKSRHKMSDAFLTLIYDGRRETFFTEQLMALMRIADKNNLPIWSLRGSWAGAMGHFQFIPTTLQQYGADGNGDGRIDVINNVSDAMFSAGNYLNKLGWDKNEKILRIVAVPADFDASLADGKTRKSLDEWAALGVKNLDGAPIPRGAKVAGLVADFSGNAPLGGTRVAYLTYDNFYRIRKWNSSNHYAIAIALLAEKLKQ